MILVSLALFFPPADERIVRIVDTACGGFLLALGAATNALFRSKSDTSATQDLAEQAIDKLPPPTGEAAAQRQGDTPWTA